MKTIALFLVLSGVFMAVGRAVAQDTAFTYQGQIENGGAPANGTYNLIFSMFAGSSGGTAVAGPVTNNAVAVSNGLFTATIDFGAGVWNGTAYWLEVGIATNGSSSFTTLSPRQQLTPVPYAIAAGNVAGTLNGSSITPGTITAAQISSNQVVTSLNNLQNAVILAGGANVSVSNVGGNKIVIAAAGGGGGGGDWLLTGNSGTQSGVNFIGTTDNETLELRVQNTRGFHLEPGLLGAFGPAVPNVIGGSINNSTAGSAQVQGAAIGGGDGNTVAMRYGTIAGGQGNYISGVSPYAAIGGGMNNSNYGSLATIGGGLDNAILSLGSYSDVGGGRSNKIFSSSGCMIGGGELNAIDNDTIDSTIAGGYQNYIGTEVDDSTISGGNSNTIGASGISSTIGGGLANTISERCSYSTIGGGNGNLVAETSGAGFVMQSAVAGGGGNSIKDSSSASISGGSDNAINTGDLATIGGGEDNLVEASSAVIGGGANNFIFEQSESSAICGGAQNIIDSNSPNATILGGLGNSIGSGAMYATVAGGRGNVASGTGSFAAGQYAQAFNDNTFVWSDGSTGTGTGFSSVQDSQFLILAHNGVGINKNNPAPGVALDVAGSIQAFGIGANNAIISNNILCATLEATNGISCQTLVASVSVTAPNLAYNSDRNLKENFLPVSGEDALAKVAALRISRWNFKKAKTADHIGPMAQDFHAAFGLGGNDDKHITVVDEGGVALAAIQGLNQKVDGSAELLSERIATQRAQLQEKDGEIQDLKRRLERLERLVEKPPVARGK